MRLLPRVGQHVPSHASGLGERHFARLADMRLLPRVGPHVNSQLAGIQERLFTRLTTMGFRHAALHILWIIFLRIGRLLINAWRTIRLAQ